MSVRRLAAADRQPAAFAFTAENEAWAAREIAKYPQGRQASAVIPLLWKAQEQEAGWLPQKAIEAVALRLDMPYIRVLEVATFYTMFNLEPVGRHFVQLCGTVPCHLVGARDLRKVLEKRVGPERTVSADGKFSWLEVECLGACCNAPMVQINVDYYEDLTPENFETLLDDLAAGRPVKTGSQIGRVSSEPKGGAATLTDPTLYDGSVIGAWRKRFEEETGKVAVAEASVPPAPVPVPAPVAVVSDAAKPALFTAPPVEGADDLELIRGVGPKLADMLRALGVYRFDQIAAWSDDNIAWIDQNLGAFKGRARRDDWISQARKLATGWRPTNSVGDKPVS
jgi:NADH-quinone oxidoreductase subunit E